MDFILAEKPIQAAKIAYALEAKRKKHNGIPYYVGNQLVVGSAIGHLFNLQPKGGGWNQVNLSFEWVPVWVDKKKKRAKKFFDCLKWLFSEYSFSRYIIGCDLDIEGSTIGFITLKKLGVPEEKMFRLKFHALTPREIRRAYSKIEPLDRSWINAGCTRHFVDALYGINLTVLFTKALQKSLGRRKLISLGRVQTPTLKFVVQREKEIESFKPKKYWLLKAKILINGKEYTATHKIGKIYKKEIARQLYKKCKKATEGIVIQVQKAEEQLSPPLCFNLSSLQSEAWRIFKFTPNFTLKLAQQLYLQGLTSYPRTKTTTIKLTPYKQILTALQKLEEYEKLIAKILSRKWKPRQGGYWDGAHIALTPTPTSREAKNELERKLLDLIRRRFIATFYPPATKEKTYVDLNIAEELFQLVGVKLLSPGWLEAYPFTKIKQFILPELAVHSKVKVKEIFLEENETLPPPRYTLSSLVKEMERNGIGTQATRAEICMKLLQRKYLISEKYQLKPTPLGIRLIETVEKYCGEIASIEMTRQLEKVLEGIESGHLSAEQARKQATLQIIHLTKNIQKNLCQIGSALIPALA
ncbi:MAG TPA: DNA topoisomerase I [Thermococcus sp.]|nr:DNA topoisomerase I [Thermococcus sp.]